MSSHLQTCRGSLKRTFLLFAWLGLTFALCVVRLQRSHPTLFSFTWNGAVGRSAVQTYGTHGCTRMHACTDTKAGADIWNAYKTDLIVKWLSTVTCYVYVQILFFLMSLNFWICNYLIFAFGLKCLCADDKINEQTHITFPFRMQEFIVSRRSGLFFSLLGTSIISFPISSPCW